jgi:hypothetical protein
LNVIASPQSLAESRSKISLSGKPWLLFALIFLIEAMQAPDSVDGFFGHVQYYAYLWTVSYGNGFTRRGLLGSLLNLLHLDNGNYLLIAACGWSITLALFLLVIGALLRLLAPLEAMTRNVLLITLLLSPVTTGILVQTSPDPIQLILLVYIALTLFLLKPGGNVVLPFLTFLLFGVVSILVHEASFFFVWPALLLAAFFVRRSGIDRAALFGYTLGAVPTVLVVVLFTRSHALSAIAPMHLGATPIPPPDQKLLGSFSSQLVQENAKHFHRGITGYLLMVRNGIGALLLPLFFALILGHLLPQSLRGALPSRRRTVFAFLLPLLLSAPLWVIAYDWGRFSSYSFLLSLILLSLNTPELSLPNTAPKNQVLPPALLAILLILSGLTTARPEGTYIGKGVGADNYTLIVALLLCAISTWFLNRSTGTTTEFEHEGRRTSDDCHPAV